jgi:hypothetical protein
MADRNVRSADIISFGRGDDLVETQISVLRTWTAEYMLPARVSIAADQMGTGRHWLLVQHGTGERSDGSVSCSVEPTA